MDYYCPNPHKEILRTGLLGDKSALMRVIDKGRQIGFSTLMGLENLTIAQVMPLTYQYYIATKEAQAKKWLKKKVERPASDARVAFDGSLIIDIDTRRSKDLEKVFTHFPKDFKETIEESYICGLAASPGGVRGEDSINVTIDEFAWMQQRKDQQKEVYEAVSYFIMQGGQMTVESTPMVRSDLFWDLYVNSKSYMMKSYYCPVITNISEVDLKKDLRKQKLVIPYPWVNINLLESKRRRDIYYFKQEVLGIPTDSAYRFISPELLMPRVISEAKYMNDDLGDYKIAIDPAATKDVSAATVGQEINGVIWERHTEDLNVLDADYVEQIKIIKALCVRYKPTEIILDTTGGEGRFMRDELNRISFLPPIREYCFNKFIVTSGDEKLRVPDYLATNFKNALIEEKYNLINDRLAINHVLGMQRTKTATGSISYSGKKSDVKRDDHFFSKAMLYSGFLDDKGNIYFSGTSAKLGAMKSGQKYVKKEEGEKSKYLMW